MRIALLAPLVTPIASPFLGGAQALLADLATGLVARGHYVTLYAADGSAVPGVELPVLGIDATELTPARFSELQAAATNTAEHDKDNDHDDDDPLLPDHEAYLSDYAFLRAYRAIIEQASTFDLLHAHAYDAPAFAYATTQPLPVVHTLHLPALDSEINKLLATLAPPQSAGTSPQMQRQTRLVTVSQACAATYAPFCQIDSVIYNGIAIERIPFGAEVANDAYLLYAGRITPEKGVEDALEIALRTGRRLVLAGGIYDQGYYEQRIAPQLAAHPETFDYRGALSREDLWQLMAGAAALLCLVHWDEPFGLVASEAQATGTPVIGYARGGLREVVVDGTTGWLVAPDDLEAAIAAIARIHTLKRTACRAWVAQHFSLETMLDAYEAFYARMVEEYGSQQ